MFTRALLTRKAHLGLKTYGNACETFSDGLSTKNWSFAKWQQEVTYPYLQTANHPCLKTSFLAISQHHEDVDAPNLACIQLLGHEMD